MINQPLGQGTLFSFHRWGQLEQKLSCRLRTHFWMPDSLLFSKSLCFPGEPRTRARAHWTLSHTVHHLIIWGTLRLCFLLIEMIKDPAYTLLQGNWSSNLVQSVTLWFSGVNRIHLPTFFKKSKTTTTEIQQPSKCLQKSSNNLLVAYNTYLLLAKCDWCTRY